MESPPDTPAGSHRAGHHRSAEWFARGAFASIVAWLALTTWLRGTGPAWLCAALDWPFALACHRVPERVLSIGGAAMPLCSRCAGLWLGMCVGAAVAWPRLPLSWLRWIAGGAAVVMLAHVIGQDLGWCPLSHAARLGTGLLLSWPLGGAIGGVIVREFRR